MPLGLLPGMSYEERETTLPQGATVLLYSDGIVEAHDFSREMFGTERVVELLGRGGDCSAVIGELLGALDRFTGEELEQEDDITLVALHRGGGEPSRRGVLADFTLASEPGNEREAMRLVAAAAAPFALAPERLERLKTATA